MNKIIDKIFPPRCLLCNCITQDIGTLCATCWKNIRYISKPYCEICNFPFEYQIDDSNICAQCTKNTPHYDKLRSLFLYDNKSAPLITDFKYKDKIGSAKYYAKWIYSMDNNFIDDADYISSVPMHRSKLLNRKYNQAAILAEHIAKISNKDFTVDILKSIKKKPPQASLHLRERLKNVKGCFAVTGKYDLTDKKILLIDDVVTTGATISECAKILKKSGANKVYAITLAKKLRGD